MFVLFLCLDLVIANQKDLRLKLHAIIWIRLYTWGTAASVSPCDPWIGGACVCSSNQARFVRLELEAVCSEVLRPPLHSHCWGSVKNSTTTNIGCIVQVLSDSGSIISSRWTPVALHITCERRGKTQWRRMNVLLCLCNDVPALASTCSCSPYIVRLCVREEDRCGKREKERAVD